MFLRREQLIVESCQRRIFTNLEISCFLKLLHITLALERTTRGQEDILVVSVHVLDPVGKPRYGLVVHDSFPVTGHVGLRNRNALSDVDSDVFWVNAKLMTGLVLALE